MDAVLPGEELLSRFATHSARRPRDCQALLVAIGSPKLRRLGFDLPDRLPPNPEHRLYDLLSPNRPGFSTFTLQCSGPEVG